MNIFENWERSGYPTEAPAELSIDDIKAMVDEMIEAHGEYMKEYQ